MLTYLLNSSICLAILWLVYKLLLENTSGHRLKRFYLLGIIICAAVIPSIVVRSISVPAVIDQADLPQLLMTEEASTASASFFSWRNFLWFVYVSGVVIMLYRLLRNLYALRIRSSDELNTYSHYQLVMRQNISLPFSFWNKIYLPKNKNQNKSCPEVILEHEKAHLDQRHSVDVLFIEVLLVFMWFNPLLYLLKYSIKLNHEFLADAAVLSQGNALKQYQETLLSYTHSHQYALVNNFNFPLIKKRFNIMKTQTSITSLGLRSLALLPVIALLILSCGQEEIITEPKASEIVEIQEVASKEDIAEYNQLAKSFQEYADDNPTNFIVNPETRRMQRLYNTMTPEQKAAATPWPFEGQSMPPPPLHQDVEIIEVVEILTPADLEEYNQLALEHKALIEEKGHLVFREKDTKRMQMLWNSMTPDQRLEAQPWPFAGHADLKPGEVAPPPPPPAPPKDLDYIEQHKNELNYYIDGKQVSAEKAIVVIKDNRHASVKITPDTAGKDAFKIQTK